MGNRVGVLLSSARSPGHRGKSMGRSLILILTDLGYPEAHINLTWWRFGVAPEIVVCPDSELR